MATVLVLGGLSISESVDAGFIWSGDENGDNTPILTSENRIRKKHIDEIVQHLIWLYDNKTGCQPFKPGFGALSMHPDLAWDGASTAIVPGRTPIRAAHIAILQFQVNRLYKIMRGGISCPFIAGAPEPGTLIQAHYLNEMHACIDEMMDSPYECTPAP